MLGVQQGPTLRHAPPRQLWSPDDLPALTPPHAHLPALCCPHDPCLCLPPCGRAPPLASLPVLQRPTVPDIEISAVLCTLGCVQVEARVVNFADMTGSANLFGKGPDGRSPPARLAGAKGSAGKKGSPTSPRPPVRVSVAAGGGVCVCPTLPCVGALGSVAAGYQQTQFVHRVRRALLCTLGACWVQPPPDTADAVDPWSNSSSRPFKLHLECDVQNVTASIVPTVTAAMLLQGPEGASQLVEPRFDNEIR